MKFERDDAKSEACFARRGFDFAHAIGAFLDNDRIVVRDRQRNHGEDRCRFLGRAGNRVFVVIYAMRGSAIRIISARKANRKEVRERRDTHQD